MMKRSLIRHQETHGQVMSSCDGHGISRECWASKFASFDRNSDGIISAEDLQSDAKQWSPFVAVGSCEWGIWLDVQGLVTLKRLAVKNADGHP
jgi:Ca2+-binding EF-hand superfamily protein